MISIKCWPWIVGLSLSVVSACADDEEEGNDQGDAMIQPEGGLEAGAADGGALDAGQLDASPQATQDSGTDGSTPTIDSGAQVDGGSTPDATTGQPDATTGTAPTFTSLYDQVIGSSCNVLYCHNTAAGHELEMLSRQSAYEHLVNVDAQGNACQGQGKRVVPGNPAASLLLKKLEGNAGCGSRMPKDLDALPAATIAQFRAWIAAGAKND